MLARVAAMLGVLACTVAWWGWMCVDQFRLDGAIRYLGGSNPPGVSLMVYATLVMLSVLAICRVLEMCRARVILHPLEFVGRHTLEVFLYHMLFLRVFVKLPLPDGLPWARSLLCLSLMVLGPLALDLALDVVRNGCRRAYG